MRMTIEFKRPEATAWDSLGTFSATEDEMAELRELLDGHDNPCEILDRISNRLVADALDILRADGYMARVSFPADN